MSAAHTGGGGGDGTVDARVTFSHGRRVATTTRLTPELLRALIEERTLLAIRVPGFVDQPSCALLSDAILSHGSIDPYTHDEGNRSVYLGVDRIGVPFNTTYGGGGREKKEAYYSSVGPTMEWARGMCAPGRTPIERVVDQLRENWPRGAGGASFDGDARGMLLGIARIMRAELSEGSESVHIDCVPKSVARVDCQFAANVYLQLPEGEEGGALIAWDHRPFAQEENEGEAGARLADTLRHLQEDWARAKGGGVPEHSFVEIRPTLGELVLICTRRPHAVSRFDKGTRVSMQTFIGHNQGERLECWN